MRSAAEAIGFALAVAVASVAAIGLAAGPAVCDEVVSAFSTACLSTDPGSEGYWKYCIDIDWNVVGAGDNPRDLSHATVMFGLSNCPNACQYGYFVFPDTVGTTSSEGGCVVRYYAEFSCNGDPSIDVSVPTLKFEPYAGPCEPGTAGSGLFCFYSVAPPRTVPLPGETIWIKCGLSVFSGPLVGSLPSCTNSNASAPSTWGAIKALMR